MNSKTQEFLSKEKISNQEFELISQIIEIRLKNNISQTELADKTGINQPNIARFEKNIHSSSLATTIKILDALGYKLTITKK